MHEPRNLTFHDIIGNDGDVLFTVPPRVFVVETQGVEDLVDDVSHLARGSDKHRLLAADEAHVRGAAGT